MKTLKTLAVLSTLTLAYQVSAAPLNMSISTVGDSAYITITENGQPAAGVPVKVDNITSRTVKTSADGSVIVRNFDDNSATYTFSVTQDDGSVLSTKRLLSH